MTISPLWTFILTDLHGEQLADITLTKERKVVAKLNRPTSVEVTMEITNAAMPYLMARDNQHLMIEAWRGGTLVSRAEIAAGDMAGAANTIKLTATCTGYARLIGRHVGTTALPVTFTSFDRAGTAEAALSTQVNATYHSGVEPANFAPAGATITAGPYAWKPFFELLTELGNATSGFDHWIHHYDSPLTYPVLNLEDVRGSAVPDVVFEYGTGQRNARDWGYKWDTQGRVTQAVSIAPTSGYADIVRPSAALTAIEITEGMGRRQAIVESDLYDTALRTTLLDEHIDIRQNPRELFLIQPAVSEQFAGQPQPFVNYDVGDIIEGRVYDNGVVYLDAEVRIYGITVTLDDSGTESVELLLVNED